MELRIGDPRILSLIRRWLKAGVLEDGELHSNEEGTPQGGSISVLLSDLFLHYVLNLWFEQVVKPRLKGEAWRQVRANKGAPGVDGESIEASVTSGQEGAMVGRLQDALREKTYRFQPVRRVDIPKPKGGTRPLGIATAEDRVVQTAMKLVLEPIFEADFHDCSYGYRPKRNAKMASVAIREDLYQRAWGVVEIDFQSYLDHAAR